MRKTVRGLRFAPVEGATITVYERGYVGRWILVDSFDCPLRARRMVCRPKAARA